MGKRGQKYFPCEQWKRNLDLFFPHGESSNIRVYYLEKPGRESHGNEAWKPALEGRCLAKKSWSIVGFISKKLSPVVIYPEPQQQFPPQVFPCANQQGISFSALQATLPSWSRQGVPLNTKHWYICVSGVEKERLERDFGSPLPWEGVNSPFLCWL